MNGTNKNRFSHSLIVENLFIECHIRLHTTEMNDHQMGNYAVDIKFNELEPLAHPIVKKKLN